MSGGAWAAIILLIVIVIIIIIVAIWYFEFRRGTGTAGTAGSRCTHPSHCASGLFCDGTGVCRAGTGKTQGSQCTTTTECNFGLTCQGGTSGAASSMTCQPASSSNANFVF